MVLQTNRLSLRPVSLTDIDNVHALHSLPETDAFNTLGIPENLQVTTTIVTAWLGAQSATPPMLYVFCIKDIVTNHFMGLMGLKMGKPKYYSAEVWYNLHVAYWGQGYATEALTQLLNFAFNELGLHRIEAGCAVENSASIKVLEKVGMTREGRKRKILPIRGEWKDNYCYAILEEDYAVKDRSNS